MNIIEAKEFIDSFSKRGRLISDLSRFVNLMERLDNPQDKLKFIHFAGTNGKGSCVRYCASVLKEAGYKTGEFTSPFIVKYNDRIKINERDISDEDISKQIEKIAEALGDNRDYSQFEISTALAFLYFADEKCDIVCLETGIGGLLDSTNIIRNPLVSVITSISFDHTAILGDTLTKIANQKAGIIKHSCPVVVSVDNFQESFEVIRKKAESSRSLLVIPDKEKLEIIKSDYLKNQFIYKDNRYSLSMGGKHQIFNALTAIETIEILREKGFNITGYAVNTGFKKAKVPLRAEIISKKPLIILDGAHNPSGMEALSNILKELPKKPIALIGMLNDKDAGEAIKKIAQHIEFAICVDRFYPNSINAKELEEMFKKAGCKAISKSDYKKAVLEIMKSNKENDIVFCGSLYLASEIRKLII